MIRSLHGCQSGVLQIQVRKAEGIAGLFQGFSNPKIRCYAKASEKGIDSALTKGEVRHTRFLPATSHAKARERHETDAPISETPQTGKPAGPAV